MQSIRDLIPKNKGDIATASKLKAYSYQDVKPIIPELLEWLQDCNWPVAGPIADHLTTIADEITPEIIEVLRGNDPTWKYWCLIVFGRIKPINVLLMAEIKQLTERVSKMEIEEGVLQEAQAIIAQNDD